MTENLLTLVKGMCKNLAFSEHSRDTSSFLQHCKTSQPKKTRFRKDDIFLKTPYSHRWWAENDAKLRWICRLWLNEPEQPNKYTRTRNVAALVKFTLACHADGVCQPTWPWRVSRWWQRGQDSSSPPPRACKQEGTAGGANAHQPVSQDRALLGYRPAIVKTSILAATLADTSSWNGICHHRCIE